MTDDSILQSAVANEYCALADVLSSAAESEWNALSLCEGWRVREVIAHMTMPARYDQEAFMAELRARNFDFGKLSNELATQDAQLPKGELIANLRSETLHRWTPPEGGVHGALNHVVIHALDATEPLGKAVRPPDEILRVVLDDLTRGGVHSHFGTTIGEHRIEATDLDWSYGSGTELRGKGADIALILCGRHLNPDRFEGEPL